MKTISAYDILIGVNDSSHFLHVAQNNRKSDITVSKLFEDTEAKRKWSLINPGLLLSQAYAYFVFGQEKGLIKDFSLEKFIDQIEVTYSGFDTLNIAEKSNLIKRRLRNAIAHCRYSVVIRTDDGQIKKDGDVWFNFNDYNQKKNDRIDFSMSLPTFGNIIENAGEYTMLKLKQNKAIDSDEE